MQSEEICFLTGRLGATTLVFDGPEHEPGLPLPIFLKLLLNGPVVEINDPEDFGRSMLDARNLTAVAFAGNGRRLSDAVAFMWISGNGPTMISVDQEKRVPASVTPGGLLVLWREFVEAALRPSS